MIVLNCVCIILTYLAPQAWTEAPSVAKALVSMLLRLPHIKFVIVTLGEDGCIMVERNGPGRSSSQFFMLKARTFARLLSL